MATESKTPEIIARHYEFLKWLMQCVAKFPRNQRYIFGKRLEEKCLDILELLLKAYYSRDKIELLKQVNTELEICRYFIRLSMDLKLLTIKQYEFCINSLFEIGKQTGWWLKQQVNK
jgi:hypothetical protein